MKGSERGQIRDDTHRCHRRGLELEEGDEVLFNDRKRPLTVVGDHERSNTSPSARWRGEADHYRVVELKGNGTEYHLICLNGSSKSGPMLYKEADWDEDKTNRAGESPKYSRMGERVESIEVLDDE